MRIIIVGADGLIGHSLVSHLEHRGHQVIGTTRHAESAQAGDRYFLDLAAPQMPSLPDGDVAIICAAMAKFSDCRNQPDLARQVNVTARLAIARNFIANGGRVIMLSSSIVFDCLRPRMNAMEPTAPRNVYGRLSADAETGMLHQGGNVFRLTKVLVSDAGHMAGWIPALRAGRTVRAFEDHRFCPITLRSALDEIAAVAECCESGIFQISGAEDISYADAARHLAFRIGIPQSQVAGALAVDNGISENEVTPYTSLDTSRVSAMTGFVPPAARTVIDEVFAASRVCATS